MKRFMFYVLAAAIAVIPATTFGWVRSYDGKGRDVGKCVQPTSDGGYVIVGDSESYGGGEGEQDIWLIKTDDNGDTLWTRFYGNQWHDYGESVHQTTGGGYFITGNTTIMKPIYRRFLWLLRTNPSGDTLSTRLCEDRRAGWGEPTSDGGFIIAGSVIDDLDRTPLLFKVNEYGDSVWARRYDEYEGRVLYFVQQTSDGGFIGSGLIGFAYIWVLKTNSAGDVEWSKILHEGLYGYHGCVRETSDSGFVVVGGEWDPAGARGMCLYRLDQSGETLWSKWYNNIYAGRLLETEDSGFIITISGRLLRTDDAGDSLWSRRYNAGINDIQYANGGGYIMTGQSTDLMSDLWIAKTDSLGYVEVEEKPPVTHQSDWQVTPIGFQIVLRYSNSPDGFHASIFDASGRKVDEIKSSSCSGMVTWGECYGPGVYFIVPRIGVKSPLKVVLFR